MPSAIDIPPVVAKIMAAFAEHPEALTSQIAQQLLEGALIAILDDWLDELSNFYSTLHSGI